MPSDRKRPAGLAGGRVPDALLLLAFAAGCVACGFAAHLFAPHYFLDGLPVDTDSMTRIAFLDWAVGHGGLNHHLFPRDGGVHGLQLHWTAPFDAILVAVAAPFAAVHGWHDGLREGVRLAMPPLQFAFGCAAVSWLCLSLNMRRAMPWALLLVPFCGAFTSLAITLPAKYQMTSAAVATVALASAIRLARFGGSRQAAWTAAWLVLAAWMSIETLPEVAAASAVVLAGAVARQTRRRAYDTFALCLVPAALVPMVLDWGPDGFLSLAGDRYSLLHVAGFCLLAGGVAISPARGGARTARGRAAIVGLAVGCAALALLAWLHVPAVYSNKLLSLYFLKNNLDMSSSLLPAFRGDMIMPTMATVAVLVAALRHAATPQARWRVLALVVVAAETALAWRFHRLDGYPSMLAVVVLGGALSSAAAAAGSRSGLAAIPVAVLTALALFLPTRVGRGPVAELSRPTACEIGGRAAAAIRSAVPGDAVVLADIWEMPELLARVPGVRTVAGPYHRDLAAMTDTAAAFIAPDDAVVRAVMEKWHAGYVLACTDPSYVGNGLFFRQSFLTRLAAGEVGSSFAPVPTGRDGIKLLRLMRPAGAEAPLRAPRETAP